MPNIIILILSLIGRILLGLLALVLLLLLLILFFPITYRIKGERREDRLTVSGRADWLFGVLRARYSYPEPGGVTVKLLWKKLFDTSAPSEKASSEQADSDGAENGSDISGEVAGTESSDSGREAADGVKPDAAGSTDGENAQEAQRTETEEAAAEQASPEEPADGLSGKISKIKYTILKIYGKIKDIWEHLSYYVSVLREDNTAALWKHMRLRLGKILWSIRPRRITGSIVFGTGAPDTTGYLFGVYGMLSPLLHYGLCVTPDFTQQILEGNIDISGHITLWVLTWHGLKLLLDKKLSLFMKKMKAGRRKAESKA